MPDVMIVHPSFLITHIGCGTAPENENERSVPIPAPGVAPAVLAAHEEAVGEPVGVSPFPLAGGAWALLDDLDGALEDPPVPGRCPWNSQTHAPALPLAMIRLMRMMSSHVGRDKSHRLGADLCGQWWRVRPFPLRSRW